MSPTPNDKTGRVGPCAEVRRGAGPGEAQLTAVCETRERGDGAHASTRGLRQIFEAGTAPKSRYTATLFSNVEWWRGAHSDEEAQHRLWGWQSVVAVIGSICEAVRTPTTAACIP